MDLLLYVLVPVDQIIIFLVDRVDQL